jgi:hypothetical protein
MNLTPVLPMTSDALTLAKYELAVRFFPSLPWAERVKIEFLFHVQAHCPQYPQSTELRIQLWSLEEN